MAPLSLLTGAITRAAKASSMSRSVVMARQAMAAKTAYGVRSYSSGHEEESYEVRRAQALRLLQGGDRTWQILMLSLSSGVAGIH